MYNPNERPAEFVCGNRRLLTDAEIRRLQVSNDPSSVKCGHPKNPKCDQPLLPNITGASECCQPLVQYTQKWRMFKCGNMRLLSRAEGGLLSSQSASSYKSVNCRHPRCEKVLDKEKQPIAVPDS